eukprot:TRINITY_DN352_c2_g1_i5.p1 TRINITY_DN352_c2_g1~~TRINITY_DN352_c2_g1_i5.p1  ORF type:complete len:1457 (+),score=276.94 TRINITY_DN352_c2_g1_i5:217-4587(+)
MQSSNIYNFNNIFFTRDWKSVQLYANYPTSPSPEVHLPPLEYEIDHVQDQDDDSTEVKNFAENGDLQEMRKVWNSNRHHIFPLAFKLQSTTVPDLDLIERPPTRQFRFHRVLAIMKDMTFSSLGVVEPFFLSVAVYNLAERCKVTEDFNFHLNSSEMMKLVSGAIGEEYSSTTSRRALFHFTSQPQTDSIYFYITVHKILKDEVENHYEMYSKPPKESKTSKFISEVQESCSKFQNYRQAMFCGALQANISNGNHVVSLHRPPKNLDVFGFLEETYKKQLKTKPVGTVSMDLVSIPFDEKFPAQYDTSLRKVIPFSESVPSDEAVRSVELLRDAPSLVHSAYVNNFYVYPVSLQCPKLKGKEVMIEMKLISNDNDSDAPGLPVIYNPWNPSKYSSSISTSVYPYSKKNFFLDEIKIKLPFHLTARHNIVFTIYSVNSKPGKKSATSSSKDSIKTLVGYARLPIFNESCVPDEGEHIIQITSSKFPPNYLSQQSEIQWMEKATLRISLDIVSSVHPKNSSLSSLLHGRIQPAVLKSSLEQMFMLPSANQVLANAQSSTSSSSSSNLPVALTPVDVGSLITFLPATLNKLCKLICTKDEEEGELVFSSLVKIFDIIHLRSETVVDTHIQNSFELSEGSMFVMYCLKYWNNLLKKKLPMMKDSVRYSRYVMAMLFKAMTLRLYSSEILNDDSTRQKRFQEEKPHLIELVEMLSVSVANFATLVDSYEAELGRYLTYTLAHFLNKLVSILDRGVVFDMITKCLNIIEKGIENQVTKIEIKLVFLRVIAQNPYYTILNCPVQTNDTVVSLFKNISTFRTAFGYKHYLAGCILSVVNECFSSKSLQVITMALNVLGDVLSWHDKDTRYSSQKSRSAIASIYFPFFDVVINNWANILKILDKETMQQLVFVITFLLKETSPSLFVIWWEKENEQRIMTFFKILQKISESMYLGEQPTRALRSAHIYELLEAKQTPRLILFTSKTAFETATMMSPDAKGNETVKSKFLKIKRKTVLDLHQSKVIVSDTLLERFVRLQKKMQPPTKTINPEHELLCEKHFNHEKSLSILDVCVNYIAHIPIEKIEIFEEVFRALIKLFSRNQSTIVLRALFGTSYHLIPLFSQVLFRSKNTACGDLISEILRHCNFSLKSVRNDAASLYVNLIESNLAEVENFSRVKLQSMISITKLAGESLEKKVKFDRYISSIKGVTKYFENKKDSESVAKQVKNLEDQMISVIKDHEKMGEFVYDPEMMCTLYNKISSQLLESPDLRITWLENLANFHKDKNNLEECAQTKIFTAALVEKYLELIGRWDLKISVGFDQACPNISSLCSLPDKSAFTSLESDICLSNTFLLDGIVNILKDAIDILKQGEFYELAVSVYQVLLPLFQELGDYSRQRDCYRDLVELTDVLTNESKLKQRIFSNYYRVGFYGKKFQEMNGKEYVYKEPNTTMLAFFYRENNETIPR